MTTTRYLSVAILLAMVIGQGCGKRDEGPEKIRALEEKHVREIAQLEETHGARIKNYEQMLAARDRELRALSGQLAAAGDSGAVKKAPPAGLKASESPQAPAVTPATSPLAGAAKISPGGIDINLLEQFAEEYVSSLGESDREKFTKDARALIASLQATTDASPPLQRKEELMRSLQERISASGYDREKSALENRLKCIEGASEDDLPGVLDYYQKLDNIDTVNRFMQDYNISREELSEYGIEPPPRSRMWPDAKEIANSLRSFVEDYASLVDCARR